MPVPSCGAHGHSLGKLGFGFRSRCRVEREGAGLGNLSLLITYAQHGRSNEVPWFTRRRQRVQRRSFTSTFVVPTKNTLFCGDDRGEMCLTAPTVRYVLKLRRRRRRRRRRWLLLPLPLSLCRFCNLLLLVLLRRFLRLPRQHYIEQYYHDNWHDCCAAAAAFDVLFPRLHGEDDFNFFECCMTASGLAKVCKEGPGPMTRKQPGVDGHA